MGRTRANEVDAYDCDTAWLSLSPPQVRQKLKRDFENVLAAMRWSAETGDVTPGLELAGNLGAFFWEDVGAASETRRALAMLFARERAAPAHQRARARIVAGALALHQGDYAAARGCFQYALDVLHEHGEDTSDVDWHGWAALGQGDLAAARKIFEGVLAQALERGDTLRVALSSYALGSARHVAGDHAAAVALLEDALTRFRGAGLDTKVIDALQKLGYVAQAQGHLERATAYLLESLDLAAQSNYRWRIASCLAGLAGVARGQDRVERAARLFGAAEAVLDTLGLVLDPDERFDNRRHIAALRGELSEERRRALWKEGRALSYEQALAYARGLDADVPIASAA